MNRRRQPVAYLDVTHNDAAASQVVAVSQRRRLGIPEVAANEPLPAPSSADVQRSGKAPTTKTPPAPGRSPAPTPSPDRGGRTSLNDDERGYVREIVAADYARRAAR